MPIPIIMTEDYPHMCELCFPDGIEFGFIGTGSLILYDGKYMLLCGQGHRDDEIYTFPEKPTSNPLGTNTLSDDEWDALPIEKSDEECKWIENIWDQTREARFHLRDAYDFVAACIDNGDIVEEHGSFWQQIWHRCGELIEEHEIKQKELVTD
ncbi:MAG: hypothetical protein ACXAC5_04355 [Promethearchaeota archaeon]|jgi:hypothetical protein